MTRINSFLVAALGALITSTAPTTFGAEIDEKIAQTVLDYGKRLEAATEELVSTRERIASERAPLDEELAAARTRVAAIEAEVAAIETTKAHGAAQRARLEADVNVLNKNRSYMYELASDGLQNLESVLLPGEIEGYVEPIAALRERLDRPSGELDVTVALDAVDVMLRRLRSQVGGSIVQGTSLVDDGNRVVAGRFAFIGPEAFFMADDGSARGSVRNREGSPLPVTYSMPAWDAESAGALFAGRMGEVPVDASGGKALQLRQHQGSVWDHLQKGGIVGYIILGLGAFAVFASLTKLLEIRHLAVDEPSDIQRALDALQAGVHQDAERAIGTLRATCRELFQAGQRHLEKPAGVLDEHLYAVILRLRMRLERRLPLLTVIVAAAPLLGLLGTVTGMVKTFSLITVFGTGNAGKLSSGISEALVTTELGLMVAIPTLVIHGYLQNRTQRNLALLERYSVDIMTVAEERRAGQSKAGEATA